MKQKRRKVDIVVISDTHLGTRGSQAKDLLSYLKSIKPGKLILNGDILDIWQFKKYYWPKAHMKVVKQIINFAAEGVDTYYITGNHDEILRKFTGLTLGHLHLVNDLVLDLNGKKAWFFHGDVFDMIIQNSKWLAKAGAFGYDLLIVLNNVINYFGNLMKQPRVSMSKKIKDNVKTAVKYITNFEDTAARVASKKGYDYVVCGHIHKAQNRLVQAHEEGNEIIYLNSGDWIENLTALEYHNETWSIYEYRKDKSVGEQPEEEQDDALAMVDLKPAVLLEEMFLNFQK